MSTGAPSFVIQHHAARGDHYDFRAIVWDGGSYTNAADHAMAEAVLPGRTLDDLS